MRITDIDPWRCDTATAIGRININRSNRHASLPQWVISVFGLVFRWDQRLRPIWPNRSTLVSAGVEFNQSPQRVIADVIGNSSLISLYSFVYLWISEKSEVIFTHQNLISNWLTYLVHAKSTGELISFGFSDRSVRSLVSAKRSANRWVQTKNDFTFWLIFGLSPNLGLSETLSEFLIQKVKWPTVPCRNVLTYVYLLIW